MKTIQKHAIFIAFSWILALPAMEKPYDLTNPLEVQSWAKSQGIPMTSNQSYIFAAEQLAEKEFDLYSRASTAQKKNWDKYDLTNALHVAEWAKEVKKMILHSNEVTAFAKVWKKQLLTHRITQLEEDIDLKRAISLSKKENPQNNEPAEIDLTSVEGVLMQARAQGVKMSREEAAAIVRDVLFQQQVQNMIENVEINNAPEVKPEAASNNADEVSENECPICLEDMNPNDKSIVAISKNCSHKFHPACSAEIKKKRTECPMCNAKIE